MTQRISREELIAQRKAALRTNKQQNRVGYDSPWSRELKAFKPQTGKNRLRILPFPNQGHYALSVMVHYGVGPDNAAYLCLDQNEGGEGECPICAEANRLRREAKMLPEGPKRQNLMDQAYKIKAKERRLVLLIDRDNEGEGIQYWAMPYSIDKNLIELAEDTDSGEPYYIAGLFDGVEMIEDGHDILFRKDGEGMQTKYTGEQIRPTSSPLSDSPAREKEWLSQLSQITQEDLTRFYSAEHISKVFLGTGSPSAAPAVEAAPAPAPAPEPAAPEAAPAEAPSTEDITDFLDAGDDDWS